MKANKWQRVLIHPDEQGIVDANHPENIIAIVFSNQNDTDSGMHTLFIDDIEFLSDVPAKTVSAVPVIVSAKGYAMHIDISWEKITNSAIHLTKIYRSESGSGYHAVGIQPAYKNRYTDFTGETGESIATEFHF